MKLFSKRMGTGKLAVAIVMTVILVVMSLAPVFTSRAFADDLVTKSADISISISGEDLEYWEDDIPSRITFKLPGTDDIKFGSNNLTWKDDRRPPNATGVSTTNPVTVSYDYDNDGDVAITYVISNANTKITSLKINGTDYTSSCPQTDEEIFGNISEVDGARSTKPVGIIVPFAESYDIEVVAEEHDLMGGFGWNYLSEETLDGDSREDCIAHGTLSFVRGEYKGNTYNSAGEWNDADVNGARIFSWKDGDKNYTNEAKAWGSAAFPKGAKITMKLIPDKGYQLVSLYGDENVVPEEEPGVYTITMAGGMNSHLMARFAETKDIVNVTAGAVSNGTIAEVDNPHGEGTMKLGVDDANVSAESKAGFDGKAGEENAEIKEIIDINLANTIYKATDDPDQAWDRGVSELDTPASITLELANDYSGEEIIVIHEHDGEYEVLENSYDSGNNSVSFKTDSFSNYAIATVILEDESSDDSDKGEPGGDESGEGEPSGDTPEEDGQIKYTLENEDASIIVEFTSRPDVPFALEAIEYLSLSDEELAAVGVTKEFYNAMLKGITDATKASGDLLAVYEISVFGGEPERSKIDSYIIKIKITDDMKDYSNLQLTLLDGLGEENFSPGNPIALKEVDGYLVATVENLGVYALNGTPKKEESPTPTPKPEPSTPTSNSGSKSKVPATGDENNLALWFMVIGIAAIGTIFTKSLGK